LNRSVFIPSTRKRSDTDLTEGMFTKTNQLNQSLSLQH
jgi:hypothetical protein